MDMVMVIMSQITTSGSKTKTIQAVLAVSNTTTTIITSTHMLATCEATVDLTATDMMTQAMVATITTIIIRMIAKVTPTTTTTIATTCVTT